MAQMRFRQLGGSYDVVYENYLLVNPSALTNFTLFVSADPSMSFSGYRTQNVSVGEVKTLEIREGSYYWFYSFVTSYNNQFNTRQRIYTNHQYPYWHEAGVFINLNGNYKKYEVEYESTLTSTRQLSHDAYYSINTNADLGRLYNAGTITKSGTIKGDVKTFNNNKCIKIDLTALITQGTNGNIEGNFKIKGLKLYK